MGLEAPKQNSNYIQENMAAFSGVLLFGSYLTDFILGDSNSYGGTGCPILSAVETIEVKYNNI